MLACQLISSCAAVGISDSADNIEKEKQKLLRSTQDVKSDQNPKSAADKYDQYAKFCADKEDWTTAKEYFDKAISVSEKAGFTYETALHCQNAAWAEHQRYYQDQSYKPDLSYAKKAVESADKVYGKDKNDYFLWTLGDLQIDRGEISDAKNSIQHALAIASKTGGKASVYHLIEISRLHAYEHDWDASLDTFLEAYSLAKTESGNFNSYLNDYFVSLNNANPERSQIDFSEAKLALAANDFDKLDSIINQTAKNHERLADGEWLIDKLYKAICPYSNGPESKWQNILDKLSAWTKHNPNSANAKIALAKTYVSYAWNARGSGWADTVSKTGWKKLNERLVLAAKELQTAEKLGINNPCLYTAWASLALGQGWKKDKYDTLIQKCNKEFPAYLTIKMDKAYYLQTRWYGEAGEWETYIAREAALEPDNEKDTTYAQLVWSVDRMRIFKNIFAENKLLDWPRVKAGMQKIIQMHPKDISVRAEYIKLALAASDEQAMKDAFKIPVK